MRKKIIRLLIIPLFILSLFFVFSTVYAQDQTEDKCADGKCVPLINPLGNDAEDLSVNSVIANIISTVLGIVGSLALIMFVYGGLTWMTAAGNNERVEKGKNVLIWATIGLIVIFTSYALVEFVIKGITGAE